MPFESQAQSRLMHDIDHNPELGKKLGIKPSVAHEFVQAGHGQKVRNLPQRVLHKDDGGNTKPSPRFKW